MSKAKIILGIIFSVLLIANPAIAKPKVESLTHGGAKGGITSGATKGFGSDTGWGPSTF